MKFRVEVHTVSCQPDQWTWNSIKHDTVDEATDAAKDLFGRWTAVQYWRVVDDDGKVITSNLDS